jgi:hypothetical protein
MGRERFMLERFMLERFMLERFMLGVRSNLREIEVRYHQEEEGA